MTGVYSFRSPEEKTFNLLHIYYRKELKEKKQSIQTKDYDCLDIKEV